MRKKVFLVLLSFLFLFCSLVYAGTIKIEVTEELELEQEVEAGEGAKEEKKTEVIIVQQEPASGFKGNGGPLLAYMQLDLAELNANLPDGFAGLSSDMLLFGGGGLIGMKEGIRFGGYGYEGETSALGDDGKKIILKLSYGGLLYEKGIFSTKDTDIALGVVLGGGQAFLDMTYGEYADWTKPNSNSYERIFGFIMPEFSFHHQFSAFMGLDLTLAYLWDFTGPNWKYYGKDTKLPLENLSAPMASLRLSFGF